MREMLERCPTLDAVLCATDRIAFGAMEVLKAAGRKIPEDVSVIGMGNSWASSHIDPHLTSVVFYYKTCGEIAAKQLIERMRLKNRGGPVQQTKLSFELRERGSV